jgi:hypothetical protein
MLSADGLTKEQVLRTLPYEARRRQATAVPRAPGAAALPDDRRYRDYRECYERVGLLYEEDDGGGTKLIRVTELGKATRDWVGHLNNKVDVVLASHATMGLAACQLANPMRSGRYSSDVEVFPCLFIWEAMLRLNGWLSFEEITRAIMRTANHDELLNAVERIRAARRDGDASDLGLPVDDDPDRITPWMAQASFGWLLIADRTEEAERVYRLRPRMVEPLSRALSLPRRHRIFDTKVAYVRQLSRAAALPRDLR